MPVVWEANPFYESVLVHRSDAPRQVFSGSQELSAEPHLPGLRIITEEVFED